MNFNPNGYCDEVLDLISYKFNTVPFRRDWQLKDNCSFEDTFQIRVDIEKQCFNLTQNLLLDENDLADAKCPKMDGIVS